MSRWKLQKGVGASLFWTRDLTNAADHYAIVFMGGNWNIFTYGTGGKGREVGEGSAGSVTAAKRAVDRWDDTHDG